MSTQTHRCPYGLVSLIFSCRRFLEVRPWLIVCHAEVKEVVEELEVVEIVVTEVAEVFLNYGKKQK